MKFIAAAILTATLAFAKKQPKEDPKYQAVHVAHLSHPLVKALQATEKGKASGRERS